MSKTSNKRLYDRHVKVRVTRAQLAAWKRAAKRANQWLSVWMRSTLDKEAGK